MYNKIIIRKLKSRVVLKRVVSSYMPIRNKYDFGKRKKVMGYVGFCPFHKEKTPSFHLYQLKQEPYRHFPEKDTVKNKGTWGCKCFGCGWVGDVFAFVMKFEDIDFKKAFQVVNDRGVLKKPDPQQLKIAFTEGIAVQKPPMRILRTNRELYQAASKDLNRFKLRPLSTAEINQIDDGLPF